MTAVAIPESSPSVDAAYQWCRRYTRDRAQSFYVAFRVLPTAKRNAIYAAYAFAGSADDIADQDGPADGKRARLEAVRRDLAACYAGERSGPPWIALGHAVERFRVPQRYFDELLNGIEMDLTFDRYQTWDDLHRYCYRVASMVGLICIRIFGHRPDPYAEDHAVDVGIAMQLTNIMRDVKEDAARGRIYLPREDLARFGLTDADILAGRYDDRFVALMRFEGARARDHYARGRRLLPLMYPAGRMCVNTLQGVYFELLQRIEARRYDVFSGRVRLSGREKLLTVGRLWMEALLPWSVRRRG